MFFSVDGVQWNIGCSIERISEIKSSNLSGELLNNTYFNDVKSVYLRYNVKLVVPKNKIDKYNQLYEVLTQPVEGHTFIFPYGGDMIQVIGRVESVSDNFIILPNKKHYWTGISFVVKSNVATKSNSLEEAITRGRLNWVDTDSEIEIGSIWEYTENGFVQIGT